MFLSPNQMIGGFPSQPQDSFITGGNMVDSVNRPAPADYGDLGGVTNPTYGANTEQRLSDQLRSLPSAPDFNDQDDIIRQDPVRQRPVGTPQLGYLGYGGMRAPNVGGFMGGWQPPGMGGYGGKGGGMNPYAPTPGGMIGGNVNPYTHASSGMYNREAYPSNPATSNMMGGGYGGGKGGSQLGGMGGMYGGGMGGYGGGKGGSQLGGGYGGKGGSGQFFR